MGSCDRRAFRLSEPEGKGTDDGTLAVRIRTLGLDGEV